MHRLAMIHLVTERRSDRQTVDIMMTIADHTAWQYDRLFKTFTNNNSWYNNMLLKETVSLMFEQNNG